MTTAPIRATRTGRFWPRARPFISGLAGFAVLAALMELLSRSGLINQAIFPPSTVVLPVVALDLVTPSFLLQVLWTLAATLAGIAIAVVIAVPLGLLIGSYRSVSTAATPIVDILRSIPGISITPLLILTLGETMNMEIELVTFVAVWPLLLNTIYGVRAVDRVALETAYSFRIGTWRTWRTVVLPSSLPLVLTGLRLAISTGLTIAVATEVTLGPPNGIGYAILTAIHAGHYDAMFAAVIVAGLLGWALNWLSRVLTRGAVAWETRGR